MALELDPLNSNDIESYHHDNDSLDEWQDKLDRIWIIDGRLNLFKLQLEREVRTIKQVPLLKFKSVQTILETTMRGVDFIRISVTDRCFTMFGRTINYETGQEWDFYPAAANSELDQRVLRSESLPFSHLQVALLRQESDK